jgi:hypothetical protein
VPAVCCRRSGTVSGEPAAGTVLDLLAVFPAILLQPEQLNESLGAARPRVDPLSRASERDSTLGGHRMRAGNRWYTGSRVEVDEPDMYRTVEYKVVQFDVTSWQFFIRGHGLQAVGMRVGRVGVQIGAEHNNYDGARWEPVWTCYLLVITGIGVRLQSAV